jgi:probable HAF family extracellular repeat protein
MTRSSRAILIALFAVLACYPDKPVEPGGENHPPRARLSVPAEAQEGTTLTFSAAASIDDDDDPLTYELSFGDGSGGSLQSTRVEHTYRNDGVFTAMLIVHDTRGAADTAVSTINVVNVAPQIRLLRIPEYAVGGGIPTQIEVQYFDPGLDDVLHATISFSLSGSVVRTGPLPGPGINTQTFLDPGQYSVRVTVQDDKGAIAQEVGTHTLDIVDRYEMVELGSLGGNLTTPTALNDSGHVVGCSELPNGDTHAFLWRDGVIKDLAPASDYSCAHTLTNSGTIGGVLGSEDSKRIARWTRDGALSDLGTCCGEIVAVVALSGSDLVAGGSDSFYSYYSSIWQDGTRRDLGGLSDLGFSAARAMNNRRQIVGFSRVSAYAGLPIDHAFVWEDGVIRDLGLLADPPCPYPDTSRGCGESSAIDINNDGTVIGWSSGPAGDHRGVRWIEGRIEDLGFDSPLVISSTGDIAGNGKYGSGEGYFWRRGVLRTLGSLGGRRTVVADMNDRSTVLATSWTADSIAHVVVWNPTDGRLVDLGPGSTNGAGGAFAVAINWRGDVIGVGVDKGHAILWRKKA